MIGINSEILSYIYENPAILEYLRYHASWYKILYYEPNRFNEFVNEAKAELKITFQDRVHQFQNQVNLVSSLVDYMKK